MAIWALKALPEWMSSRALFKDLKYHKEYLAFAVPIWNLNGLSALKRCVEHNQCMDFLQNWLYLSSVFLSFHKSVQRGTSYLQIISPDLSVTVFVTSHLQRRWATGRGWARHMQRHAWAGAAGVSVTHTYSLNHSFSRILCLCVCFTYSSMTVFNPRLPFSRCGVSLDSPRNRWGLALIVHKWLLQLLAAVIAQLGIAVTVGCCVPRPWHLVSLDTSLTPSLL